ncbi:MAG: mandelate racemase, partial [Hyphomicrobiales bacterium]|nr:mandelate racemase [Hyphomicrobiales bacterium]
MRIVSVQERTVSLGSATANAAISFATMTASAVVAEVETAKGRFHGLGFSSIGRYGHGGLLRERFIPRLMAANAADFIDPAREAFSMDRLWSVLMRDEKEGGHGERSGAVGVLETALWDAWAKSEDLPLWALLQREFGHVGDSGPPPGQTLIYASGGHYHAQGDDATRLADEARQALDAGYGWFKLKAGGAPEHLDLARIEAAV